MSGSSAKSAQNSELGRRFILPYNKVQLDVSLACEVKREKEGLFNALNLTTLQCGRPAVLEAPDTCAHFQSAEAYLLAWRACPACFATVRRSIPVLDLEGWTSRWNSSLIGIGWIVVFQIEVVHGDRPVRIVLAAGCGQEGGEEEAGCADSFRGAFAVRPALPRCRPSYVTDSTVVTL